MATIRMSSAAMGAGSNNHMVQVASLSLPWDAQETSPSKAQFKLTILFKHTVTDLCHCVSPSIASILLTWGSHKVFDLSIGKIMVHVAI